MSTLIERMARITVRAWLDGRVGGGRGSGGGTDNTVQAAALMVPVDGIEPPTY